MKLTNGSRCRAHQCEIRDDAGVILVVFGVFHECPCQVHPLPSVAVRSVTKNLHRRLVACEQSQVHSRLRHNRPARIRALAEGDSCSLYAFVMTITFATTSLPAAKGWEVELEEDRTLRRLDHYRDWHRVERAMALFEREVQELTARMAPDWRDLSSLIRLSAPRTRLRTECQERPSPRPQRALADAGRSTSRERRPRSR